MRSPTRQKTRLASIARMLCESGGVVLAGGILCEIIDMCGSEEMMPYLARALWFLGSIEGGDSGAGSQERARERRGIIADRDWVDGDTYASFMRLVGLTLW